MSQVSHVSLSFTYAGMAGLSLASLIGVIKLWKLIFYSDDDERHPRNDEVRSLRRSLSATRSDAKTKDDAMDILRKEMMSMQSRLEDLGRALKSSQEQNEVLEDRVKAQMREAQMLRDETLQVKTKHVQTVQLLEARTLELRGAEAFLNKADTLSGADVIAMINSLNSEIYQTAALLAESFEFKDRKAAYDGEAAEKVDIAEVYASATEILGSRMVELLKSSEHHEDQMLIQIAFQAGMSAYSNWIITSWYFEDPEDEHLLSEIYKRVRETEEQAVSGRWRALTRAHVQRMSNSEPDLPIYFIDAFINILLTAGVDTTTATLQQEIETKFKERVSVIVQGAQRLRRVIGEEVTSCDFEILYTAQETIFNPNSMDDTFAGDYEKGRDGPEPVLCTTDLGLARVARIPGKVGEWDEVVLLRPKVVLQSGVTEMMSQDTS